MVVLCLCMASSGSATPANHQNVSSVWPLIAFFVVVFEYVWLKFIPLRPYIVKVCRL